MTDNVIGNIGLKKQMQDTKRKNRIKGYKFTVVYCLVILMVGLILAIFGSYIKTEYNLIFTGEIVMALGGILALIYAFLYFTVTRN